jgi:acetyl-CoA carboxylase carboxyltransferase component
MDYQNLRVKTKTATKNEIKTNELNRLRKRSAQGGGQKRVDDQHSKGKLTARERINYLLDPGSFDEIGSLVRRGSKDSAINDQDLLGDSVVTGYGTINNSKVFIYSQDFTVCGGTTSEISSNKICKIMDMAADAGVPIIGLLDSGGARIQDGVSSLIGCGEIFTRNTLYSGVVPQISVIMGPCAGAATYSPALTDFIFMVNKTGQMYITGPIVLKAVTGEEVSPEDSGGADIHSTKAGNCHFVGNSEQECLDMVKRLLSFLPSNNKISEKIGTDYVSPEILNDDILDIVPEDPNKPYDMKKIIYQIVDNGDFMEVQEKFGRSILVGFARLAGKTIGIVAQQPIYFAGAITVDASDKAARFIRFCDCFNIPVISLVDVPGYMPGTDQEHQGIIRHGAKLLYAYAEATTIKISIIIRKAYGGAFIAMGSKSLRGDLNLAWPTAELAVMGPDGAINILYRQELNKTDSDIVRNKLINEYREKFANPYIAAGNGYIDEVIDPRETRNKIIKALKILENKSKVNPFKKHGNIPL